MVQHIILMLNELEDSYYILFSSFSEKLTFRDIVSPQEFRQGEDAEVVCRVTSSPAPIVSWLYRNEEVATTADS